MAVTRIKNNQVTDASGANTQLGINANTKIQNFSITSGKLANNLTYGSDLTITGNLTVQGTSTAIDTTITTIEDPIIVLASTQTAGAPAVDIGFMGFRGNESNIAFVWDESADSFVTAFTSTAESNTTITITSLANLQVGNLSLTGNILNTSLNVTGNITGGNLLTPGLISATSTITSAANITGGNVLTGGLISATSTITSAANVSGGNLLTAGLISATSTITSAANITGGNLLTAGLISATGNVTGNFFLGNGSQLTGVVASSANAETLTGTFLANNVVGSSLTSVGILTALSVSGTTTTGNLATAGTVSATGNVTGGNVLTGGVVSATANITGGNLLTAGLISATSTITSAANITGGNLLTGGVVSATANVTGGNLLTGGLISATANITGGNLLTAGLISATSTITSAANVIGGNITTAGLITATGNVTGGNLLTAGLISATGNITSAANVAGGNLKTTGGTFTGTLTTSGDALIAGNLVVQGNLTYINIDDLRVEDPVIILGTGPNGAPLTTNDGKDRGVFMEYFITAGNVLANAFMGYDNSTGNMFLATNVTMANDVVTVVTFGTLQAGNLDIQSAVSSGNITGGNLLTGGLISAAANVTGGNITTAGQVTATANITGGNLLTGGLISATSTITSAANITGGNLLTAGLISATGTITSAANVIGGNISTAGVVTATGNIQGGNLLTAGLISATSTITSAANITGGNILSGGQGSFTGNVTAANFIGNISGNIDAGGANTQIQFNDSDILAGSAGFTFDKTSNAVVANGNITGSNFNTAGVVTATGNVTGGNVLTGGLISATSTITSAANITGGNLLTAGLISATSTITSAANVIGGNISTGGLVTATGNVTGGNIVTGGLITATGTITGANLILTSGTIDGPAAGRITINGSDIDTDFAVDGDTLANVFYVDAGTGTASFGSSTQVTNAIVNFATTTSLKVPVGNTAQRPATGVTGMMRFNTTTNSLEIFNNTEYTAVGVPSFTVIDDEQFNGDGTTVAFTLGSTQTTNSCIVSINGVVQVPTVAYSVAGTDPTCVLTFTEAPLTGDLIDVRQITTTTSVTSISNSPGNAVIATNATLGIIDITGNVVPTSNITFDLGSANLRWNDLYLAGNSIVLGNTVIKNTSGNSIGFFGPDGTTAATIDAASVDTTQIASGTSNVKVVSSNGNVTTSVGGTSNVMVISSTDVSITGNLSVSGNATLSGNILGDRIQNGTTQIDIQTTGGNANITVGGISNVAVFATTGAFITGVNSVSGNVTGGNVLTGGLISATGNITGSFILGNGSQLTGIDATSIQSGTSNVRVVSSGGNVATGIGGTSNVVVVATTGQFITGVNSVSGNVTGGNLLTGGLISATSTITSAANVTGGNLRTAGLISATGAITGAAITGTSLTVTTGNITGGNLLISGAIEDSGQLDIRTTASNANIVFTPNGSGNVNIASNVMPTANATANIGSAALSFNTVFAKATSAQYADLAEKYTADATYAPGTVVMFGGPQEITLCVDDACSRVAGVISTNPSYRMNDGLVGVHTAMVALTGRVPTLVTGTVRKGDMMVSAGAGRARAEANPEIGTVIGKALADHDGADGVIEVVVGRV